MPGNPSGINNLANAKGFYSCLIGFYNNNQPDPRHETGVIVVVVKLSSAVSRSGFDMKDAPALAQALLPLGDELALQRVVRIEKNLNSLGFFSPSSKIRNTKKVISVVRELPGGIKTEAKATIIGHETGLPNTADL